MSDEKLEQFLDIVFKDEATAKEMLEKSPEEVAAFASQNGCECTAEEVKAVGEEMKEVFAAAPQSGELSEDDLDAVAGGRISLWKVKASKATAFAVAAASVAVAISLSW